MPKIGIIVPRDINTMRKPRKKTLLKTKKLKLVVSDPLCTDQRPSENRTISVPERIKRSPPTKFVCACGKEFKRNQSLNNHRNFVCGKMKQRYCTMCKKFFWAHQQLIQHQKVCHNL